MVLCSIFAKMPRKGVRNRLMWRKRASIASHLVFNEAKAMDKQADGCCYESSWRWRTITTVRGAACKHGDSTMKDDWVSACVQVEQDTQPGLKPYLNALDSSTASLEEKECKKEEIEEKERRKRSKKTTERRGTEEKGSQAGQASGTCLIHFDQDWTGAD